MAPRDNFRSPKARSRTRKPAAKTSRPSAGAAAKAAAPRPVRAGNGDSAWLRLWAAWLQQPAGTHLDKWLRTALPRLVPAAAAHTGLVAQLHKAVAFQQLICALEWAFERREPMQDWIVWDARWQPVQLTRLPARVFEEWLLLRVGDGQPSAPVSARGEFFALLQRRLPEDPALQLLWQGLRPQWQPALQARQVASGWTPEQRDRFIRLQSVQPPLWLRAAPAADLPALCEQLRRDGIAAALGAGHLSVHGGRGIAGSSLHRAGVVEVQDLGSQQVAAWVAAEPGQKVWDACAGAGGKSLAIAGAMQHKGTVLATDLHAHKLQELKRRARRAGLYQIRSFPWDGTAPLALPKEVAQQRGFDWVLVDAPCSAAGTWRRNPDARWRYCERDSDELIALQQRLLANACPAVRAGGYLVYATCSWDPRENEQQVAWFLAQQPDFSLVRQSLLGCPDADADTLFAALLQRRPAA